MSNPVPEAVMTQARELQANIAGVRNGCDGLEAVTELAYNAGRESNQDAVGSLALTEQERAHLGHCALTEAHSYEDARYHQDLSPAQRLAALRRWEAIANALDPAIYGTPNVPIQAGWLAE